ncbi:ParA family protein [Yersinia enterocolitica]|nr:ParA family protein [Yersinia enterocolitica]EKN4818906.1 ParA family protein [Yersinia enterocolitica]EKN4833064.1 ParA family protein [Yersinia enterocolitica]
MAKQELINKAPVVSVLNMKGGVGKTTISAHVFRLLYHRLKKATLLVDFDPQFNLTQTVISQARYDEIKKDNKTILSVMEPPQTQSIFSVNTENKTPPKQADIAYQLRHIVGTPVDLSIIPGDFDLVKYSLLENTKTLSPAKERFLKFIEESRKEKDLICIDCNPSSSFMTNCAVLASTHILVPIKPDRYSLRGLEMLDAFLDKFPAMTVKPKLIILLNGISNSNYDSTVEDTLRAHAKFGPLTMVNTLGISKLLEANPSYTGFATDKKVANKVKLTKRISFIVDELGQHLGL